MNNWIKTAGVGEVKMQNDNKGNDQTDKQRHF